jgi:hypothetical protein
MMWIDTVWNDLEAVLAAIAKGEIRSSLCADDPCALTLVWEHEPWLFMTTDRTDVWDAVSDRSSN